MHSRMLILSTLLVSTLAHADNAKRRPAPAPLAVTARVVGLQILTEDDGKESCIITIRRGSDAGLDKTMHARFREGDTKKPLAGGDATIIRIDHRSAILKTRLPPEQVRANRIVELTP